MTRLPQVLVNVQVAHRDPRIAEHLADDIAAAEAELGDHGRVLLRPSGTEPLVRVMVEASSRGQARAVADRLASAVVSAPPPDPAAPPGRDGEAASARRQGGGGLAGLSGPRPPGA